MAKLLIPLLAVIAIAIMASPLHAQGPACAPRQVILDDMAERYKEAPVSWGVTNSGALLEVLASPTGSWSIILTIAGQKTCMIAAGKGWRTIRAEADKGPPA